MTSCVSSRRPAQASTRSDKDLASTSTSACTPACTDPLQELHISHDLAGVIDAWPSLPEAIRAAILAMIQTTTRPKGKPARKKKE